jgi:hypothetical protein
MRAVTSTIRLVVVRSVRSAISDLIVFFLT